MELKQFTKELSQEVVKLWNDSVVPYSIYKPFTDESFENIFLNNKFFTYEGSVVAIEDGKLVGFGNAMFNNQDKAPSETPGYISCIMVDKDYQRRGIGSAILKKLEEYLISSGKTYVRNFYACPINFRWFIPNTDKHEHPGAPAVPFNSPYYFLLMANGYNVNGQLDGYHMDITNYELPKKVIDRLEENRKNGYDVVMYEEGKHHGFDELFEALKSEGWANAVKYNLAKENPNPMLIVQKEGEILGWTGPLFNEPCGRGYFAGIGVHPKTQGLGLGKALFCMLCYESKKNGAQYMTLFTGAENKAREIYLYAGFRLVQSFAIMKKELKK